jgi:beta-lactamase regulating signal transducer with metallopeptidase domain
MGTATGLTGNLIQAFSWMLIHSLWQGLILSLVAGIILTLTRKYRATIRYNLVLALFAVFLFMAAGTFCYEWNGYPQTVQNHVSLPLTTINNNVNVLPTSKIVIANPINNPPSFNNPTPSYTIIRSYITAFSNYFSQHSFMIVMLWFIFFIAKAVSMTGNILYMQRARNYRVFAPMDEWQERMSSLCEKLQLKRAVTLLESGYVKVPVVIGHLKPVILIPVGLIAGIPAAQVEAVLLHELAHIHRNDYMVNFLQNITETVFFFNPGLLWISSLLREERENCCDDMAIAQTNNKENFVQALISFKEYSANAPAYAVAFSGQKSTLLNRVMRIVYQENKTIGIKESGIFIAALIALSLTAFTLYPVKETKLLKPYAAQQKPTSLVQTKPISPEITPGKADTNLTTANQAKLNIDAADKTIDKGNDEESSALQGDTAKVSAISSIKRLGPNPLVIIDGKEYPSKILYQISGSCLSEVETKGMVEAVKKFGDKAKDGCVEIKTFYKQIVYMTAIQKENLAKENAVPATQFYTRLPLKNDHGIVYDKIVIQDGSIFGDMPSRAFGPRGTNANVAHNGRVAFFIDDVFYDEAAFKKLPLSTLALINGEHIVAMFDPKTNSKTVAYRTYGVDPDVFGFEPEAKDGINYQGYSAIFWFQIHGAPHPYDINYLATLLPNSN